MLNSNVISSRVDVAKEYFRRIDNGDPAILDIMTDDVEAYFPKYGVGYGKADFMEIAKGLMGSLQSIKHDLDRMTFHEIGDFLIAEGFESGVMADGTPWPIEGRSEGRFVNVFGFSGNAIKRVYIYVDPDFATRDKARFLWRDKVKFAKGT